MTREKLRRLAHRSLTILNRHAHRGPQIACYEHSLRVTATAYMTALDTANKATAARALHVAMRDAAVRELGGLVRSWLPVLRRDVDGMAKRGFGDAQKPIEDLIADQEAIEGLIELHLQNHATPLPYLDEMNAQFAAALDKAKHAAGSTSGSRQEVDELQATVRESAAAFSRDLVAFRATLRTMLGHKAPDYRALRVPAAANRLREFDEAPASEQPDTATKPDGPDTASAA